MAASSAVELPTRTFGSVTGGSSPSSGNKKPGGCLAAQPARFASLVNRTSASLAMAVSREGSFSFDIIAKDLILAAQVELAVPDDGVWPVVGRDVHVEGALHRELFGVRFDEGDGAVLITIVEMAVGV